jgi:type III restriction enzyme
MPDQQILRNEDLVLRVSTNVDPDRFDIDKYEPFIDALCSERRYQKDAIRIVLRYLLSDQYNNLRELAEENYYSSDVLQQLYGAFDDMERHLQLPDQLSCSVDLATATGKSYVMYAVARIMLAEGAVDRVLVLCPSITIENGLMDKFRKLSGDNTLKMLLPESSIIRNPHIINGTESITDGSICVENFHATLVHVRSSIRDSLAGKGERTLVLNDEAHHVYNPTGATLKRWKEFLVDPEFNFRYVVGFSGTCYIKNDYFTDVITRYSLRSAIEDGYAQSIDYVDEDSSESQYEKFQKIYDNHIINNTQSYRLVKPITILVTRDIASCKRLTTELIEFLAQHEGISRKEAADKVLPVTSDRQHRDNVRRLDHVDLPSDKTEWIPSVSMLTEGWDVKNVFQIVPHEERAFNSKLLVSQVLGRGLRIPDEYRGERPVVTVFNHAAWSSRIKSIVNEVLEIEKRISSFPVSKATDYDFSIHQVDYSKQQEVEEFPQVGEYEFSKGYVSLVSQAQELERETTYARAIDGSKRHKRTRVKYQMLSIDEVAEQIHNRLQSIDLETEETRYADRYSLDWLRALIKASLDRVGEREDVVSEDNRQRLYRAFNVLHRAASKTVRYRMIPGAVKTIMASQRNRDNVALGSLRYGDMTVFIDDDSISLSDSDTTMVLREMLDDESLPISSWSRVDNTYLFKTVLNVAIANHKPERQFISQLVRQNNANALDAWLRSTDQDFYPIEFSYRRGEHPKRGHFNPDFFIKKDSHIFVIEIKEDREIQDPSPENKGKYKAAVQHLNNLNGLQSDNSYHFHFLTPKDYDKFFSFVRDSNYEFVSELDAALDSNGT